MTPYDDLELPAPVILFPGQLDAARTAPESAYRVAHDLLTRRAAKEALEVLEPALTEDPDNQSLLALRAWAYLIRVQLGKAEADLRLLIERQPDDVWARHALGRALERQSRPEEALPHLRLAAAMSGDLDHEVAMLRVERTLLTRPDAGLAEPAGS